MSNTKKFQIKLDLFLVYNVLFVLYTLFYGKSEWFDSVFFSMAIVANNVAALFALIMGIVVITSAKNIVSVTKTTNKTTLYTHLRTVVWFLVIALLGRAYFVEGWTILAYTHIVVGFSFSCFSFILRARTRKGENNASN